MSKKLTIEFVKGEFEKEGYTLVSTEYIDNKHKLDYTCPKGHNWSITWSDWKEGCRCAKCKSIACSKRLTGKKTPDETKKKISNSNKGLRMGKDNHNFGKDFSGDKNPNWNPELTNEERKIKRNYPEYKEWCFDVKKQANFTCQVCGQVGSKLHSHHLEDYSNNPELRTTLSNGVCLCETCHLNFHHQYGKLINTKEQFLEFKENYVGNRE